MCTPASIIIIGVFHLAIIDQVLTRNDHFKLVQEKIQDVNNRLRRMSTKKLELRSKMIKKLNLQCLKKMVLYAAGAW